MAESDGQGFPREDSNKFNYPPRDELRPEIAAWRTSFNQVKRGERATFRDFDNLHYEARREVYTFLEHEMQTIDHETPKGDYMNTIHTVSYILDYMMTGKDAVTEDGRNNTIGSLNDLSAIVRLATIYLQKQALRAEVLQQEATISPSYQPQPFVRAIKRAIFALASRPETQQNYTGIVDMILKPIIDSDEFRGKFTVEGIISTSKDDKDLQTSAEDLSGEVLSVEEERKYRQAIHNYEHNSTTRDELLRELRDGHGFILFPDEIQRLTTYKDTAHLIMRAAYTDMARAYAAIINEDGEDTDSRIQKLQQLTSSLTDLHPTGTIDSDTGLFAYHQENDILVYALTIDIAGIKSNEELSLVLDTLALDPEAFDEEALAHIANAIITYRKTTPQQQISPDIQNKVTDLVQRALDSEDYQKNYDDNMRRVLELWQLARIYIASATTQPDRNRVIDLMQTAGFDKSLLFKLADYGEEWAVTELTRSAGEAWSTDDKSMVGENHDYASDFDTRYPYNSYRYPSSKADDILDEQEDEY